MQNEDTSTYVVLVSGNGDTFTVPLAEALELLRPIRIDVPSAYEVVNVLVEQIEDPRAAELRSLHSAFVAGCLAAFDPPFTAKRLAVSRRREEVVHALTRVGERCDPNSRAPFARAGAQNERVTSERWKSRGPAFGAGPCAAGGVS